MKTSPDNISTTQPPFITFAEVQKAGSRSYAQFLDPTYFPGLGETAMEVVEGGREEAFFIPIVRLAAEIALVACSQESVYERLPAEVSERAFVAQDVARLIGEHGARSGLFLEAYRTDRHLRRGLRQNPTLEQDLRDDKYLPSQCEAPFREVSRVAGGAYHALRRRGVNIGQADIVAASQSLPLAASIPKEHSAEIYDHLGIPYISPRHYLVSRVDRQTVIGFAPDTIDYLRSYTQPHRGCPALNAYPYGRDLRNLLRESWENIVYYLLLPGAKVRP